MTILGKKPTRNLALASALVASLFGFTWYGKARNFNPPANTISVSIDDSVKSEGRASMDSSIEGLYVVARPYDSKSYPYSVGHSSKDPGFPWRFMQPWEPYFHEIIKTTPVLLGGIGLGGSVSEYHYEYPTTSSQYNTIEIKDTKRNRTVHIFTDLGKATSPPAPYTFNNENHALITYNGEKFFPDLVKTAQTGFQQPSPPEIIPGGHYKIAYLEYYGDLLLLDLESLATKKVAQNSILKSVSYQTDKFVYSSPTSWGWEGYVASVGSPPVRIWSDKFTRYDARISPEGKFVAYVTAMRASTGGYNVEIYEAETGKTTTFPENYEKTKVPFSYDKVFVSSLNDAGELKIANKILNAKK